MAGAAGQNEAMPNGVIVRDLVPREKHDTHGVEHSARNQQDESAKWNAVKHRLDGYKREPTHQCSRSE